MANDKLRAPDHLVQKIAVVLQPHFRPTPDGASPQELAHRHVEQVRLLLDVVWAEAFTTGMAFASTTMPVRVAVHLGPERPPAPWEIREAATGGGPCRCGKSFYTHVCLSCSPDCQTPGPGCGNCRHTGMDQTPCKPQASSSDTGGRP